MADFPIFLNIFKNFADKRNHRQQSTPTVHIRPPPTKRQQTALIVVKAMHSFNVFVLIVLLSSCSYCIIDFVVSNNSFYCEFKLLQLTFVISVLFPFRVVCLLFLHFICPHGLPCCFGCSRPSTWCLSTLSKLFFQGKSSYGIAS